MANRKGDISNVSKWYRISEEDFEKVHVYILNFAALTLGRWTEP